MIVPSEVKDDDSFLDDGIDALWEDESCGSFLYDDHFREMMREGFHYDNEMDMDNAFDYDPFDDYSMDDFMDGEELDFNEHIEEARILLIHRVCECINLHETLPQRLILEAELHMHYHRYREALHCAIAVQILIQDRTLSIPTYEEEEFLESLNMQLGAIQFICAYQLNDKNLASHTMQYVEPNESFSSFLYKRTMGTKELFNLLPQLLEAVKNTKDE